MRRINAILLVLVLLLSGCQKEDKYGSEYIKLSEQLNGYDVYSLPQADVCIGFLEFETLLTDGDLSYVFIEEFEDTGCGADYFIDSGTKLVEIQQYFEESKITKDDVLTYDFSRKIVVAEKMFDIEQITKIEVRHIRTGVIIYTNEELFEIPLQIIDLGKHFAYNDFAKECNTIAYIRLYIGLEEYDLILLEHYYQLVDSDGNLLESYVVSLSEEGSLAKLVKDLVQ